MRLQQQLLPFFFLIFFALTLHAARVKSPTNDEAVHLLHAHALVSRNDFRYETGHPPVTHRLIGLLLPTDPSLPALESLPSWDATDDEPTMARELFINEQAQLTRLFFIGRIPIIWAGLLFGAVMIRWARGSLVMATLWAFAPNWLAHTSLAATDAPATITFGIAGFAIWHYRRHPTRWYGVFAGIAVGCTLAAKVTGILILPISGLLLLTTWKPSRAWWRTVRQWLFLLPFAALTVWAIHGFEWRSVPYAPFPLPAATYLDNFFYVSENMEGGRIAYLFGEIKAAGWWHYFVVAFLAKTPLPVLLLLAASVLTLVIHRQWWTSRDAWLPIIILFAVASYIRLNIGFRHILPIFPFIWLLIVWGWQLWRGRWVRGVAILLLGWYAVDSILQAPDYISYFNVVSRGSAETILGDSNIDWGQDFWQLLDYAKEHEVTVSYSGFLAPQDYGLTTLDIDPETGFIADFPPANPAPGRYAISVNHLHGTLIREPDAFAWFRDQTPIAKLGGSIHVYDVPASMDGEWIAHCAAPQSPLQPLQVEQIVGRSELRHLFFDCSQSWVFPTHGSGWILLPAIEMAAWVPDELTTWEVIYRHRSTANSPDYTLLYLPQQPTISTSLAQFGEAAQLLDYWQNETEWLTLWRAGKQPIDFLSILAHLYDDTETPLAVADGLGFASVQWESADLILQRHTFPQAVTCENGRLATGLYDSTNGERISLPDGNTQLFLAACIR